MDEAKEHLCPKCRRPAYTKYRQNLLGGGHITVYEHASALSGKPLEACRISETVKLEKPIAVKPAPIHVSEQRKRSAMLVQRAREAEGCENHSGKRAIKFAAICDGCLQWVVVSQME